MRGEKKNGSLVQTLVCIVLYLNTDRLSKKKKSAKVCTLNVYKGTVSEFMKIVSHFLEILCMLCGDFSIKRSLSKLDSKCF